MVPIQSVDDATESKPIRAASRDWACRQSWAGVTRTAANRAVRVGCAPFRHVMRRQSAGGNWAAQSRTAIARTGVTIVARVRGRPRRIAAGGVSRGRVVKTVRWEETAHRIRQPQPMQGRAKRGHVAEFGVGEDRRPREPRRARVVQQAEGQPPFS